METEEKIIEAVKSDIRKSLDLEIKNIQRLKKQYLTMILELDAWIERLNVSKEQENCQNNKNI